MIIKIKPLSVNEAFKGRRYNTDKYKRYKRDLTLLLPPINKDLTGKLKVDLVFGFSSHGSDIDNPLKPLIDILQKKYNFNDNQIFELNIKKKIVSKENEFIKLKISKL